MPHFLEGPGFMFLSLRNTPPTDSPISDPSIFDSDPKSSTRGPIIRGQKYPALGWDPLLKAMAIAAEFSRTGWTEIEVPPPPKDPAPDIEQLIKYRDEMIDGRLARREEITAQAMTFWDYFERLLGASPPSRPHTQVLIKTGIYVGGFVVSYWKLRYMRARPVQVSASVFPTILTPPHPSYPSGHALEAFLAAACTKLVVPEDMHGSVDRLAERIAVNREYAGVHYPSDTMASKDLAAKIFERLNNRKHVPEFAKLVELAASEWKY